jgi:phytol kinase
MLGLLYEAIWDTILFIWVMIVVYPITKNLYRYMRNKGLPHVKAVYYNRKIIHILAGGLVALTVPYLFQTPLLPGILAAVLAIATYLPHRSGRLMYWFQVEDNMYEVNFCIMWGIVISLAWLIFHNWWYGVIPVAFMAFGDGVTGIVRNMLYNRRTKAWIGNIAMAILTIPIGYITLGYIGGLAGLIASITEHFEIKPIIDDNITVPLISFLTLLIGLNI